MLPIINSLKTNLSEFAVSVKKGAEEIIKDFKSLFHGFTISILNKNNKIDTITNKNVPLNFNSFVSKLECKTLQGKVKDISNTLGDKKLMTLFHKTISPMGGESVKHIYVKIKDYNQEELKIFMKTVIAAVNQKDNKTGETGKAEKTLDFFINDGKIYIINKDTKYNKSGKSAYVAMRLDDMKNDYFASVVTKGTTPKQNSVEGTHTDKASGEEVSYHVEKRAEKKEFSHTKDLKQSLSSNDLQKIKEFKSAEGNIVLLNTSTKDKKIDPAKNEAMKAWIGKIDQGLKSGKPEAILNLVSLLEFLNENRFDDNITCMHAVIDMLENNKDNYSFDGKLNYFDTNEYGEVAKYFNESGIQSMVDELNSTDKYKGFSPKICSSYIDFNKDLQAFMANKDSTSQSFIVRLGDVKWSDPPSAPRDGRGIHFAPIHVRKEGNEVKILLMDALGVNLNPTYLRDIEAAVRYGLNPEQIENVSIYSPQTIRQYDHSNCPVFSLRDLQIIHTMEKNGENIFNTISDKNESPETSEKMVTMRETIKNEKMKTPAKLTYNSYTYPPKMMEVTQSTTGIQKYVKTRETASRKEQLDHLNKRVEKHSNYIKDTKSADGGFKQVNQLIDDRFNKYSTILLTKYLIGEYNKKGKA